MSVRRIKIGKRWVWQARVAFGKRRVSRLCGTREEGRGAEADLIKQLKDEARQEEEAGAKPATLRVLCKAYVLDLDARGKSEGVIARAVDTERALEAVLTNKMDQPLTRFGEADIYAFRQARIRSGVKESTVNRDLRTIRAMMKRAFPGFRFPKDVFFPEDETRVRWLSPEEEILVLETIRPPFREIAKLAAMTLMRLTEIRLLRREQVRLEQGVVLLPRAKGGPRSIVLSRAAQEILRAQLDAHNSPWVFPAPHGRYYSRVHISRVFRNAARAQGLQDFTFHDLRHHGATMALNAGFSGPIVMALGGWKTERMMRRYAAVTDKTLRAAAEAVTGNREWQTDDKSGSYKPMMLPSQGGDTGSNPVGATNPYKRLSPLPSPPNKLSVQIVTTRLQ